jgi:hypothetical protein
MLNLPQERRTDRKWQREFFKKEGLDLESKFLKTNYLNTLNLQATKKYSLQPLDINLLKIFFDEKYLKWINKNIILTFYNNLKIKLLKIPKIGKFFRIFFVKGFDEAYSAYLCLKPIEKLLKKNK